MDWLFNGIGTLLITLADWLGIVFITLAIAMILWGIGGWIYKAATGESPAHEKLVAALGLVVTTVIGLIVAALS